MGLISPEVIILPFLFQIITVPLEIFQVLRFQVGIGVQRVDALVLFST